MDIVKIIISIIFVALSIFLAIVVLMQEGKASGLGAVAGGASDTYWSKNKNRSGEGKLETGTKWGIVVWLLLALVLNLSIFA